MKRRFVLGLAILLTGMQVLAQEINKMDSKGQRDGLWKGTHTESGRPRYEGTFKNGKETGIFKFFDDTKAGTVIATRDFTAADGSCYTTFFDQKGNKVSEGREVNKMHEGQWKTYHKQSPVVMSLDNYSKGKLDGIQKVFFINKAISEETGYTNGVKNGIYKKYTEKGIVLEEAAYKNGEFHGLATYRDVRGSLVAKGQFTDGKKTGIWKFYENDKVVREENMSAVRKSVRKKTQ